MERIALIVTFAALLLPACGGCGGEEVDPIPDSGQADVGPKEDVSEDVIPDDTAIVDLTDAQKYSICQELSAAHDGPTDVVCSPTEQRHVMSVDECVAKLDQVLPCATVGPLRGCFDDFASCGEVDRDACWFFISADGSCTAPYLGHERAPVSLSVLPPVPVDCAAPGARQRIPFMIGTRDVIPLVPGDLVNGLPVTPGLTFDGGSFAVRGSRVSQLSDAVCVDDSECPTGFRCAAGGSPGAPNQCTRQNPVTLVPESLRLDVDPGVGTDRKQIVGVLIENTSLLDGRLPTASGSLYGEDGERDLFADAARATDPTRLHRQGVEDFLVNLASVASNENTLVTAFWFAGQFSAEARPLYNEAELEDHFTNDLALLVPLIDAMPEPVPKPANVWQAARAMVRKDFGLSKYADHEKFLYIFVDGPNEVWDATDDVDGPDTYEKLAEELVAHGVRTYIVHLDAAVDPTLIRDVPTYYAGHTNCQDDASCAGAPPCASDAQCENFESCRPAVVYGANAGDPVTQTTASYCMPRYNDEGRLGPIDQYADLACQTGGSYMYVTQPQQMGPYWGALASTVNGQFSVEAEFAALRSSNFPNGWYRLSGVFLGMVGPSDLGFELSGPVEAVDIDNRAILRMGR